MRQALELSYDGAAFHGWQFQRGQASVQAAVEAALARFLDEPVRTVCAGRTDAGVHALAQTIHLDTQARRGPESWLRGLNALLPPSIAVQQATAVAANFHARFSALARHYFYVLHVARQRSPFFHGRAGWVFRPLDVDAMREAGALLLGTHDFSCFRSSQCQAASPVRTLHVLDIVCRGELVVLHFCADGFLHHMIRNIVGALVYVGLGRQAAGWLADLLCQGDRRLSAPTFSPSGLYLAGVHYPPETGLAVPDVRARMHALTGIDPGAGAG